MEPEHPEIDFQWLSGLLTQERFTNYAISVLFSAEYTEAEYIFVHLGFYWLFAALEELSEGVSLGDMLRPEALSHESDACRINAETALSQMQYHIPHDYEWVLALGAAVSWPSALRRSWRSSDHLQRQYMSSSFQKRPWLGLIYPAL